MTRFVNNKLKVLDNFAKNLKDKFPWIYDELNGISNGANIKFDEVNYVLFNWIKTIFKIEIVGILDISFEHESRNTSNGKS